MTETSERELDIIRHSLGMTKPGKRPYRNFFAADPGHTDMPTVDGLVGKGLMFKGQTEPGGSMSFYHVSEAGCALVGTTRAEAER